MSIPKGVSQKAVQRVCNAISFTMADWPTLYSHPARVLDHWFFTIGNGIDFDPDTSSFKVGGKLVHKYPIRFDAERQRARRIKGWEEYERANAIRNAETMEKWRGRVRDTSVIEAEVNRRVAAHQFPTITPENLTKEAILGQIMAPDARRDKISKTHPQYKYRRPYPLSSRFSLIFDLTEQTPPEVLWVAREFCAAWAEFLQSELDSGNFFEINESYEGTTEMSTRALQELISECEAKLTAFLNNLTDKDA